jgi:hypothetical protein
MSSVSSHSVCSEGRTVLYMLALIVYTHNDFNNKHFPAFLCLVVL